MDMEDVFKQYEMSVLMIISHFTSVTNISMMQKLFQRKIRLFINMYIFLCHRLSANAMLEVG